MNRPLLILAMLLSMTSCLSNESPVALGPAFPLTGPNLATCTIATISQTGGSFDVASENIGANYLIALEGQSSLNAPLILDTLGNEQGNKTDNDFIFSQVLLAYQSTPALGLPSSELIAASDVVVAGAAGTTGWIGMFLFGPKALTALPTSVPPGSPGGTVVVTMTLKGQLRSGEAMQSNSFGYPISVFNSGFAGCGAVLAAANGPCGSPGGEDGNLPKCCVIPDGGTTLPTGCTP